MKQASEVGGRSKSKISVLASNHEARQEALCDICTHMELGAFMAAHFELQLIFLLSFKQQFSVRALGFQERFVQVHKSTSITFLVTADTMSKLVWGERSSY